MNGTARVRFGAGIVWALALALLCGLLAGSAVRAEPPSRGGAPSFGADAGRGYAAGRILVKTEEGVSAAALENVNRKNGGRVEKKLRKGRISVVGLPENLSVEEAVARYEASPDVEYAEPDFIMAPVRTPDDPSFSNLWGLNNTGQTGGTSDADIDAPEAWDVTTGDPGTIVAVIDTGVDINHPDLDDNVWVNADETPGNGVDDDGNGYVDDVNGWDFLHDDASVYDAGDGDKHGTHVAGTIAAEGDNGEGVSGANWDAAIMPLKFLGPKGGSTSHAIAALDYAVANGARISNNSWGGGGNSQALRDAIDRADAAGHLFAAAAGNSGRNNDNRPSYPASYPGPNIISVAATDSKDALASFSNYGANSVDLAAPGVGIHSTLPGNSFGSYNGTSMATPHVAGTAALILSANPELDDAGIKARLLDSVDEKPNLASKMVSGGRLNAAAALGVQTLPADTPLEVSSTTPRDGATGVRRASNITATFSEEMDRLTLTGEAVTLKNAKTGATVGAVVSCDDPCRTVTVDPSETLAKRTRYIVTIEGGDGGVKTPAGEAMAADEGWSFTTGRR